MANYTIVRGDVKFNNLDINANQFALLGLSDTANLVLMYENYGVEARLAYNWRDEFLNRTGWGSGNPGYIEEHKQIDMNVTYHFTDNLDVSLEGINITGEDRREHARNKNMMIGLDDLGARYQMGVRYTF
jgi:outer membrane receptor protein involved in Fe transport